MYRIPIAVPTLLAKSLRKAQVRTKRSNIHQTWKGDDPVVHGINDITTVELEERVASVTQPNEARAILTKRPSASH